jgi:hypothetical protein
MSPAVGQGDRNTWGTLSPNVTESTLSLTSGESDSKNARKAGMVSHIQPCSSNDSSAGMSLNIPSHSAVSGGTGTAIFCD